jgi:hypothetical protein
MMTVFIGGSRSITELSPVVIEHLERLIAKQAQVLIGDAPGADLIVQTYLARQGYRDVIVFCSGGRCRNNVGSWQERHILAPGKKGRAFYTVKDEQMAQEADYGFMLWDGMSIGTLNNLSNLLASGKKTLLYLAPADTCTVVTEEAHLLAL